MTVAGPERASTARMPAEEMQRTSQRASGRAGGVEDCSKSAVQCSAAQQEEEEVGSRRGCKRCKKMNDDCVEAGGSWSWSGRGVGLTSTHYHWTGPLHLEDSTASVKQVKLATAR